jgi:DNA-binding MarR family transcriptional regulator
MDINQTLRELEILSRIQVDMQLSTLRTLLFVAQRGQCNQADIENYLGISRASVSRNIAYWTKVKFNKNPGSGFLTTEEDPVDRRHKIIKLTYNGQLFIDRMRKLNGSH